MSEVLARACAHCGNNFPIKGTKDRKKYCNRSCSTSANNLKNPRRKLTKSCATCDTKIGSQLKYCKNCNQTRSVLNLKIGEVTTKARYQVNSQLREIARRIYKKRGLPYVCLNCNYKVHVEICHIKDLWQFDSTALVSETCKIDNLVALCRNCHWEFDHGYLEINTVTKELKSSNQGVELRPIQIFDKDGTVKGEGIMYFEEEPLTGIEPA